MNIDEKKELKYFIEQYKQIENSVKLMQASIESLSKKRDQLFDEIGVLTKKESDFMNSIIEKYGESEVTPFKLLQIYNEDL